MKGRSTWIDPKQAKEAIERGNGRGIKIAVIDSGVELTHPGLRHFRLVDDIAMSVRPSGLIAPVPGRGMDLFGHGTAVAGIIRRVAPEAQIGSIRILNDRNACRPEVVGEGVRIALDRGYHILNCSLGIEAKYDLLRHFKPWVDEAYQRGVHVVSACNNQNFRSMEWPACFPSVITVNMARTTEDGLFYRWDPPLPGRPPHLVEFAARGVDLDVLWREGQVGKLSGSSFAAPHVAGLLARLLSVHPGIKPLVAKSLLQEAADVYFPELCAMNE